jgi:hypothetical protein
MLVDTNSYLRALIILSFFNSHTSALAKELTHVATYNRFVFTAAPNSWVKFVDYDNYEQVFADSNMTIISQTYYYDVPNIVLEPATKHRLLLEQPLIDKFPATNSSAGGNALNWLLKFKHCMAKTISEGKNYSLHTLYQEIEQRGFNF